VTSNYVRAVTILPTILTKELFASKSTISCKVTPFPTLAYIIVKGFAKLFPGLGIEKEKDKSVYYYSRVTKLSKG
jgi:hypothetical protein